MNKIFVVMRHCKRKSNERFNMFNWSHKPNFVFALMWKGKSDSSKSGKLWNTKLENFQTNMLHYWEQFQFVQLCSWQTCRQELVLINFYGLFVNFSIAFSLCSLSFLWNLWRWDFKRLLTVQLLLVHLITCRFPVSAFWLKFSVLKEPFNSTVTVPSS